LIKFLSFPFYECNFSCYVTILVEIVLGDGGGRYVICFKKYHSRFTVVFMEQC